MFKKFSFWIWATIEMQLLTAGFHSLSFFAEPQAKNDTEKQLVDLVTNYKPDAGMGFHPSFHDLFTGISISFTLLFIFGALLNIYFKRNELQAELWRGFLLIETLVFGAVFAANAFFTFAPPIICTGLIFLFVLGAYLSVKTK